jgi:preprotein translocase subunit SecG
VGTLTIILVIIHLLVSVLLVTLVLLHSSKDSGMGSVTGFSFASQASVMERNLTRYTVITGIIFFITTLAVFRSLGH